MSQTSNPSRTRSKVTLLDPPEAIPCDKRVVRAWIPVAQEIWEATNYRTAHEGACPREPGEGYEKCDSICGQSGHAEENLIRHLREAIEADTIGPDDISGTMFIDHFYACDDCRAAAAALGINIVPLGQQQPGEERTTITGQTISGEKLEVKILDPFEPVAEGDLESDEKGTGARRNGNKVKLEYIPAELLIRAPNCIPDDSASTTWMEALSFFEQRIWSASQLLGHFYAVQAARGDRGAEAWRDVCEVFHFGAAKYKAWNWAKGISWNSVLACAKRHAMAMGIGEDDDPESSLPHEGHLGCNIVMLAWFQYHYTDGDDRIPEACL